MLELCLSCQLYNKRERKNWYILRVCMIVLFSVSAHVFCFTAIQHCPFPHAVPTQLIMADRLWQQNSKWIVFGYVSYSKTLWGKYVNYNWNSWPSLPNRRKGIYIPLYQKSWKFTCYIVFLFPCSWFIYMCSFGMLPIVCCCTPSVNLTHSPR